tara:strand:- start:1394 stop:1564 length:171 start_codon:yes stop_codon:yes gene_type:complete
MDIKKPQIKPLIEDRDKPIKKSDIFEGLPKKEEKKKTNKNKLKMVKENKKDKHAYL